MTTIALTSYLTAPLGLPLADENLFEQVPAALRLDPAVRYRGARYAVAVVIAAWLPLVALTACQAIGGRGDDYAALLSDVAVHACYLVAAPLLAFAEATSARRLGEVMRMFTDSGIVD